MEFYMLTILNKKHASISLITIIFISSSIFASCGSCQVPNETIISKKSNSLVTVIPDSGNIEGFVVTSCGMCNFGYKENRGCSLTIKIGDTVYPVEGTKINDHGDPHSGEGFCSAIRVAYVSGKIKKSTFYSDSFIWSIIIFFLINYFRNFFCGTINIIIILK